MRTLFRPVTWGVVIMFGVIGVMLLTSLRAATPPISSEAESGTVSSPAQKLDDPTASGGRSVRFGMDVSPPSSPGGSVYITPVQAATLPKSGNGYNNARMIADQIKAGNIRPDLDDVNTRAGAIALTAATFWLANGKSDTALLDGLKTYILNAPGTNRQATQALNPMRGMGGLLAAVDIINKNGGGWDMDANCPNAGMTFRQYLNGLENRNLGDANTRWQTIKFTATDSASNWGAVARWALLMVAVVREDAALRTQSADVFARYLGDTAKAAPFRPSGSYIGSWDNTGGLKAGIGFVDAARPGLDGVVIDDINRGGTGYSATASFYGSTGSGITYPLEAAECTWATAAALSNMGYPAKTWGNSGLIRMGDWFHRANAFAAAEAKHTIYKNHRWLGNCFKGGTPYGTAGAVGSGAEPMLRSQPAGDYMCGTGSRWPY